MSKLSKKLKWFDKSKLKWPNKNKLRLTVKYKLMIVFLIVLIIPSSLIGTLSYQSAKHVLDKEFMRSAGESVDVINAVITDVIAPKREDVVIFANHVNATRYDGVDSPDIRAEFDNYIQFHRDLDSMYVGTEEGVMIQVPRKQLTEDYDPRQRPWYKKAMENKGQVVVTDPYVSAATGNLVVAVAKMTEDGSGVVGMDINLQNLSQVAGQVNIGTEGYAIVLDQQRNIVVHPTMELGIRAGEDFFDQMFASDQGEFDFTYEGDSKRMEFTTNELTGWKVGGIVFDTEIEGITQPILIATSIVIVVAIVLGLSLVFYLIASITKPLQALRTSAARISEGDLTEKIQLKNNDELGDLAGSFNQMSHNLRTLIQEIGSKSEHVAASSEELTASSMQTATASEYVASSLQEVASRAETQNDQLNQTVEALTQISMGIQKVAGNAVHVSDLTKHAAEQAADGNDSVLKTMDQMNAIYKSVNKSNEQLQSLQQRSQEIAVIVDLIGGIAGQTKLLSLNASIEAARAGEHGRGFAVVAEEVGHLAKQSEEAAKQIIELIGHILKETETTAESMKLAAEKVESGLTISFNTTETFSSIIQNIQEIPVQVEEVATLSEQIAASAGQVTSTAQNLLTLSTENASLSEDMASSTQEQLASMEEISAASASLSKLAEELQELVQQFKI
ncbi:methyl-accepting chemotaxis protein [Paenibacillus sp. FSL H7-0326]|uniref:methyl-accepting chemotaxis protein n=1 Tax=Paenibacillus sp. FSL H7-0326 TaxID=1921144 RepID=UPI0009FB359E|nr:methyl-accepting chemotaxis protein [Paenibacillus sp. FSL H7-0326]